MLSEKEEEILDKSVDQLKTWKKLIEKYLDEDEQAVENEKLKNAVKGFCEIDEQFKANQKAIEKLNNHIDQSKDPTKIDVDKLFEEIMNEPAPSLTNQQNNHIWKQIFKSQEDIMIVEQKRVKKLDDSQFEELDDSLLCSNVFTPPVDPISKAVIRNPYKNTKCKHVYEYSTITDYIQQLRHRAKCPYIGCKNTALKLRDLVQDDQLQSRITEFLNTQQHSYMSDSDE